MKNTVKSGNKIYNYLNCSNQEEKNQQNAPFI